MIDVKEGSSDSRNYGSFAMMMFIALVACVACQRQQTEERKNAEIQREMQKRLAAEHQAQVKSQAQKFQPRRIVPMSSPIRETPTSTPTSSEPPTEKLNKNETEKQKSDRKEAVQGGEGLSRLPTPRRETSPVQAKVPQGVLDPILN